MLFDETGGIRIQENSGKSHPAAIGFVPALTTNYVQHALFRYAFYSGSTYAKKTSDGKTVSWYQTYGAQYQFNEDGTLYYWVIAG